MRSVQFLHSRDLGALWHALAGAVVATLATAALGVVGFGVALALLAALGWGREWWQHRDDSPVFTVHRHIEAAAWPVGACAALVLF